MHQLKKAENDVKMWFVSQISLTALNQKHGVSTTKKAPTN